MPTGTVDLPTTRHSRVEVRRQRLDDGVQVGHVGGVLALLLRGPHADEVHVPERRGLLVGGREAQPP